MKKFRLLLALITVSFVAVFSVGCLDFESTPVVPPKVEETVKIIIAEFGSGYYTAGVDFPSGTYTVTAIEGNGNVSSSNAFTGGLNEILGVDTSNEIYSKEFKNAKFSKDVILRITGVKVQIHSVNASTATLRVRTQDETAAIELENGIFTAGTDFPAGIYTIKVVKGAGNVISSNVFSGGINAIMGINEMEIYEKEYKNISLPKDTTLKVSATLGSLTVKIIPVTIA